VDDAVRLPNNETAEVELPVGENTFRQLHLRAEQECLAPRDAEALARYLVYLGVGYLEAERTVAEAPNAEEAYAQIYRLLGGVQGETAVVRFHFGESAREYAEEERAHAAHERMAGAHEALIEKLEAEIATREQRIANLEVALGR
jgi:hypothetical protein